MRVLLSALLLLAFATPSYAADDKKVDIMNPYKEQQKKVVEKSTATNKAYNDRWYEYVEERYGGKIDRPAADSYATQVPLSDKKDDSAAKESPDEDSAAAGKSASHSE